MRDKKALLVEIERLCTKIFPHFEENEFFWHKEEDISSLKEALESLRRFFEPEVDGEPLLLRESFLIHDILSSLKLDMNNSRSRMKTGRLLKKLLIREGQLRRPPAIIIPLTTKKLVEIPLEHDDLIIQWDDKTLQLVPKSNEDAIPPPSEVFGTITYDTNLHHYRVRFNDEYFSTERTSENDLQEGYFPRYDNPGRLISCPYAFWFRPFPTTEPSRLGRKGIRLEYCGREGCQVLPCPHCSSRDHIGRLFCAACGESLCKARLHHRWEDRVGKRRIAINIFVDQSLNLASLIFLFRYLGLQKCHNIREIQTDQFYPESEKKLVHGMMKLLKDCVLVTVKNYEELFPEGDLDFNVILEQKIGASGEYHVINSAEDSRNPEEGTIIREIKKIKERVFITIDYKELVQLILNGKKYDIFSTLKHELGHAIDKVLLHRLVTETETSALRTNSEVNLRGRQLLNLLLRYIRREGFAVFFQHSSNSYEPVIEKKLLETFLEKLVRLLTKKGRILKDEGTGKIWHVEDEETGKIWQEMKYYFSYVFILTLFCFFVKQSKEHGSEELKNDAKLVKLVTYNWWKRIEREYEPEELGKVMEEKRFGLKAIPKGLTTSFLGVLKRKNEVELLQLLQGCYEDLEIPERFQLITATTLQALLSFLQTLDEHK